MPSPHVHYVRAGCPHPGCSLVMAWIDFRLEVYEDDIEKPLMRAWWTGNGFVGRCPACQRWIHFTPLSMRAVAEEDAAQLPQLPGDWQAMAHFFPEEPAPGPPSAPH